MKRARILMPLLCLGIAGRGGDSSPVNEGKDRPVPPKQTKSP